MAKTIYGPGGVPHDFPDDMDDDAIKGVMAKTYGGPGAPAPAGGGMGAPADRTAGFDDEERQNYDINKKLIQAGPGGFYDRRKDQGWSFGFADELASAGNTAWDVLSMRHAFGNKSLGERFASHQKVQSALNKDMEEETAGAGGVAVEIASGLGSMGPKALAHGAGVAANAVQGGWNSVKQFTKEFVQPKNLWTNAKIGAGFGGLSAAGHAEGGLSERMDAVPGGMAEGAVMAPVVGYALGAPIAAHAGRQAAKASAALDRSRVADEFERVGVPPMRQMLKDNNSVEGWAAPKVAKSWFGGPLRERAAQAEKDVLGAARARMGGDAGGVPVADLGDDMQNILRTSMREHTIEPAAMRELPDEVLRPLAAPSAGMATPPRPPVQAASPNPGAAIPAEARPQRAALDRPQAQRVQPVAPKPVEPYKADLAKFPPERETVAEIKPQPKLRQRAEFDNISDPQYEALAAKRAETETAIQAVAAERRHHGISVYAAEQELQAARTAAADQLIAQVRDSLMPTSRSGYERVPVGALLQEFKTTGKWDPRIDQALATANIRVLEKPTMQWMGADDAFRKSTMKIEELQQAIKRTEELRKERGDVLWKVTNEQATKAAIKQAQEEMHLRRVEQAMKRAEADAAERTAAARKAAEQEALRRTNETQAAADAEFIQRTGQQRRTESQESYATERAAAYELVRRQTPDVEANPLGKLGDAAKPQVRSALDAFSDEARLRLLVRGYDGKAFNDDGTMHPVFLQYLRKKLGTDIADELAGYSHLRGTLTPDATLQVAEAEKRLAKLAQTRATVEGEAASAAAEAEKFIKGSPKLPDADADVAVSMWQYAKQLKSQKQPERLVDWIRKRGGLKDHGGELDQIAGGDKAARRKLVSSKGMTLDDATRAAWDEGFLDGAERPTIAELLSRLDDDIRGNPAVRGADVAKLEDAKIAAQMWEELGRFGVTPDLRTEKQVRGFLTGKWSAAEHQTERLAALTDREAKITAHIEQLKTEGAPKQAGLQELHDLRTRIGKKIGDIKYSKNVPGASRDEDEVMLDRLYKAITQDLDGMKRAAGPEGVKAADMRAAEDARMAAFKAEVEKPLAKLYGPKVEPLQAMDRLVKSAQTGDMQSMRAFFKVMAEKGDTMRGVSAIMRHATRDAASLQEFVDGVRSIHPDVRKLMFATDEGKQYLKDIQTLTKAADKVLPFRKAIERGADLTHMSGANIIHSMGYMLGSWEAVVTQAAGTRVAAHFLASPRYVRWLTQAPNVIQRNPAGWREHFAKLVGMAAADGDTGREIVGAVKEWVKQGLAPDAKAAFAGEGAKTADREALARAKKMEDGGADRDAIWKETGWFKQGDGRWRFEIDDSSAKATPILEVMQQLTKEDGMPRELPLKKLIDHPELYKAYPDLGKTKLRFGPNPPNFDKSVAGYWDPLSKRINMNSDHKAGTDVGTILHEGQHAIQAGDSLDYGKYDPDMTDEAYRRIPGEAEAFNVEARRTMTKEQRRATPPWKTLDVPEGEISWSKGGPRAAINPARKPRGEPEAVAASGAPDAADIFTSLEKPPSLDEAKAAMAKGIKRFDFDLDHPEAAAAAKAIKAAGGKITAYHVGGGGGREWKGLSQNESVNKFDTPEALAKLTDDVKSLVARGADSIHFDNTHRMSGKKLEQIADAIKAGGAGFVAKNNADKWNLVMRRRPDLKPDYAVIEAAMHDADETQAAADLAHRGVETYIIGFKKPLNPSTPAVSADYAKLYQERNPWAHVLLMENEEAYEGRTAATFKRKK